MLEVFYRVAYSEEVALVIDALTGLVVVLTFGECFVLLPVLQATRNLNLRLVSDNICKLFEICPGLRPIVKQTFLVSCL